MIVLFIATLILVALTAALPNIYTQGRREKEDELIFRGTQYARAIALFHRQFNRFPTSVKELLQTNGMRFLRQEYKDPMTPKGKWRFIHANAAGALLDSKMQPMPQPGQQGAAGSAFGSGSSGSMGGSGSFGGSFGSGSTGGSFGSGSFGSSFASGSTGGSFGSESSGGTFGSGSSQGGAFGSSSSSSETASGSGPSSSTLGSGGGSLQGPTGASGLSPASTSSEQTGTQGSSSSFFGQGQVQGAFIVGVASTSKKASIRVYNKKTHYDEWEFLGVDMSVLGLAGAGMPQGVGVPGMGQPGMGGMQPGSSTGSGMFGQPNSPSGFGGSQPNSPSGFGGSQPSPPQSTPDSSQQQ